MFRLCILPFIYICQLFFSVPSMAFAIISIGLFLFGVISTTTVMLLENLQTSDEGLETANRICSVIFLMIPPYNLGMAINRLSFIHNLRMFAIKFLGNQFIQRCLCFYIYSFVFRKHWSIGYGR